MIAARMLNTRSAKILVSHSKAASFQRLLDTARGGVAPLRCAVIAIPWSALERSTALI
jgi:hypothetical protein